MSDEQNELHMGDQVAWGIRVGGKMSAISSVHRVFEHGKTFCNVEVPPVERHFPLLPTLNVCGRCATMWARAAQYQQDHQKSA